MPFKRVRRSRRHPTGIRPKRRRARVATMAAPGPASKIIKLRHVESVTFFSGVAGAVAYKSSQVNSTVGRQPLGWDQWSQFYDRYEVLSAKITCQVMSTSTSGTSQGMLLIFPSKDTAVASGTVDFITEALEQPGCIWKPMGLSTSGQSVAQVSRTVNMKKYFGQNVLDTDLGAEVDASPLRGAFINCGLAPYDPADIVISTKGYITIDYTVRFSDRKQLATS